MHDYKLWFAARRLKSSHRAALVLLVLVIGGLAAAVCSPVAGAPRPEAPSFSLTSLEGTRFNLSDFRGSVVVLDLMATWCPVCNDEMKELAQLRQARPEVVLITISVDPTEDEAKLRAFQERYTADWLFARDTDRVWEKYREFYLPTLVVIDPQGYISYQKANLVPTADLIAEVESAYVGIPEVPEEPEESKTNGIINFLQKILERYGLCGSALLLGIMSFFAPCAFPLLPGYISYYLGRYEGGTTLRGSLKAGIVAATGINGLFAMIGAAVALGASAVRSYLDYLKPGVGIVIVLLGLAMVLGKTEFFTKFETFFASYSAKLSRRSQQSGLLLYGVGYGLAVMGCQVPVFIWLVLEGLTAGGPVQAILVFLSFSIGMGCMMVTVSLLAGTAKRAILDRLKALMPYINRACGLILILVGLYFLREFF
jgi:cytochrome c-type biogenesis protein